MNEKNSLSTVFITGKPTFAVGVSHCATMKIFIILCLIFHFGRLNSKFAHRFKSVECGSSMKTSVKPYCNIKSYRRNNPVMNFGFDLTRKLENGKVWLKIMNKINFKK